MKKWKNISKLKKTLKSFGRFCGNRHNHNRKIPKDDNYLVLFDCDNGNNGQHITNRLTLESFTCLLSWVTPSLYSPFLPSERDFKRRIWKLNDEWTNEEMQSLRHYTLTTCPRPPIKTFKHIQSCKVAKEASAENSRHRQTPSCKLQRRAGVRSHLETNWVSSRTSRSRLLRPVSQGETWQGIF